MQEYLQSGLLSPCDADSLSINQIVSGGNQTDNIAIYCTNLYAMAPLTVHSTLSFLLCLSSIYNF